jgi:hypothetical protein
MKIQYCGPHDGVDVKLDANSPEWHWNRDDEVDVPDELARRLLQQSDNWKPVTAKTAPVKPDTEKEKK